MEGGAGGRGRGGADTPAAPPSATTAGRWTQSASRPEPILDREAYFRSTIKLFEDVSKDLPAGFQAGYRHPLEAPRPITQFSSARNANAFRCSSWKIPLRPEEIAWFKQIREQCTTPIAMGELFNSPHEWQPLIEQRLIDYIRLHVSQVGGFFSGA